MSIVSAIKNYLASYSGLPSGAPLWVDFLGPAPSQFSIVPLPGEKIISTYIDGSSLRSFPFAFQSMESTADELERLESNGFYELFADWLEAQTEAGNFPTLTGGKVPEAIEATGWAYLYEQGISETGTYQIQCRLVYAQS